MYQRKVLLVIALVVASCFAQSTPKITLSADRMPTPEGRIQVQGSGFAPQKNLSSHLRKPDGTEYPVLSFVSDARGEFKHEIEAIVLSAGVHELWVIDDSTKKSSNRVRFEVTQ
jgi:hypothetical protein